MKHETGFDRELRALSAQFRQSLPRALGNLNALWQDLVTERVAPALMRELHRGLHSLAGSGSTFGVPALTHTASAAEAFIDDFAQRSVIPDATQREQFARLLAAVASAVHAVADDAGPVNAEGQLPENGGAIDSDGSLPALQGATNPMRKIKVLLAEDTRLIRMVAAALLARHGCESVLVKDGIEALAAWESERFDLVLMDVQMPEMDGLVAAAAIREREHGSAARVPIVAVTADAAPGERERCIAAGMDDCVSKPLDGAILAALIRRHVVGAGRAGA